MFKNYSAIMEENTLKDRIKGLLFMVKSLKAQINALIIAINHEYLMLINITLFEEVIYKFLDPTSFQYVAITLVRTGMVYTNKFLWEMIIFKKLWSIS